jgi:alpha-galactosidase
VLSISPGPAPLSEAEFFNKYAQMWRISDDFWDDWKLLKKQFDYTRDWAEYVGKNDTWPDADMLPLGKLRVTAKEGGGSPTKLTADEQQTLMTLWSMFRSPLIFGGDLPSNDPATMGLITNDEVLAVDQHSSGNRQVLEEGNLRAWIADVPNSKDRYIAVFNLGDEVANIDLPWSKVGINASILQVRDLWTKTSLGEKDRLLVTLRPHAAALYRISS